MEYNNFLRTYYNALMDLGTVVSFTPQHVVTINDDNQNDKFFEEKDSGFFGKVRLSLSAPNNVIENEMDKLSAKFPEYDLLFLNTNSLKKAANYLANADEIKKMLGYMITIYKEMGLIKV